MILEHISLDAAKNQGFRFQRITPGPDDLLQGVRQAPSFYDEVYLAPHPATPLRAANTRRADGHRPVDGAPQATRSKSRSGNQPSYKVIPPAPARGDHLSDTAVVSLISPRMPADEPWTREGAGRLAACDMWKFSARASAWHTQPEPAPCKPVTRTLRAR